VVVLTQSMASDAASAAQQANSRVLLIASTASDVYSLLSDLESNFGSRVPKRVATDSQLSDIASDLKSAIAQANSRVLVTQSQASDIYSLLSDLHSDVGVVSGVVSDLSSGVNVTKINGVTVTGAGTSGDPWGPA
jgi:hypothetical protein